MKIKALTRVQKFIRENNVPVFNMAEHVQSEYNRTGGSIVVEPKENLRVNFSDAIYSDGKRLLAVLWCNPMNPQEKAQMHECKTQKEMIEKYMELAGIEEKEEVTVVVEKSAVAPLETPVKITPASLFQILLFSRISSIFIFIIYSFILLSPVISILFVSSIMLRI